MIFVIQYSEKRMFICMLSLEIFCAIINDFTVTFAELKKWSCPRTLDWTVVNVYVCVCVYLAILSLLCDWWFIMSVAFPMLVFVLSVSVRLYLNTSACSVRKHRFEFHSRVPLLSATLHLFNPSLQKCYSTSTVDLHAWAILSSRDICFHPTHTLLYT